MSKVMSIFSKKDQVYGSQTLYRELGNYISRLECYEKSLKFFDEIMKSNPNDRRALIQRSRARAKASHYKEALEDIDRALKINKDDITALGDKALTTYLNCEFEEGLIQNVRMLRVRQKPECFSLGIMHCSAAIHNCIGDKSGRPLRDHYFTIRRLVWEKMYNAAKGPGRQTRKKQKKSRIVEEISEKNIIIQSTKLERTGASVCSTRSCIQKPRESLHSQESDRLVIPPSRDKYSFRPPQRYTSNLENYVAEKYLDTMCKDKIFLKNLQRHPGVSSPNKNGSEKIRIRSKQAFKQIRDKQELLRFRRPFYSIKHQEAISEGALKQRQFDELYTQQQTTLREADLLLMKLEQAFEKQQIRTLLELAEKLQTFCDGKSKKLLPNKEIYTKEIIDKIRAGYYRLNRLNPNQYAWDQIKRAQVALGLPISREPSTDSVINELKNSFVDIKKQMKKYHVRLKNAVGPEEICWCYFELCRNSIEMKHWDIARIYAKKCIQAADNSPEWTVNANMLLAKISVQERNKLDAKNTIIETLTLAKILQDGTLERYLEKCLEIIEQIEFDDIFGPKCVEKRAKKILSLLDNPLLKSEFTHLFHQMSSQPAARRLNIVPGVKFPDDMSKTSKTLRPDEERAELSHQRPKTMSKSESKGIEFLDLIQYHVDINDQ